MNTTDATFKALMAKGKAIAEREVQLLTVFTRDNNAITARIAALGGGVSGNIMQQFAQTIASLATGLEETNSRFTQVVDGLEACNSTTPPLSKESIKADEIDVLCEQARISTASLETIRATASSIQSRSFTPATTSASANLLQQLAAREGIIKRLISSCQAAKNGI